MAAAGLKLYMSKRGDALKRLHLKMSKVERERSGGIDCDAWKCCWESLDVRSMPVLVCVCACKRVCRCTSPHQEVCEAYGPQTFKFKAEAITHDPKVSCVIVRA